MVVSSIGLLGSAQPTYAQLTPSSLCGKTITTSLKLTSNIICKGAGIIIGANGITLNCAGFAIIHSGTGGGEGISLSGRKHVTVENCYVESFNDWDGIDVYHGSHNVLTGNVVEFTGETGVSLQVAGFRLVGSSYNVLTNNVANGNKVEGFSLYCFPASVCSTHNTLSGNLAENNGVYGFWDTTTGSGTAGTANTYTSNSCSGNNGGGAQSSPAGLC
jgi:hypothetical protein